MPPEAVRIVVLPLACGAVFAGCEADDVPPPWLADALECDAGADFAGAGWEGAGADFFWAIPGWAPSTRAMPAAAVKRTIHLE